MYGNVVYMIRMHVIRRESARSSHVDLCSYHPDETDRQVFSSLKAWSFSVAPQAYLELAL